MALAPGTRLGVYEIVGALGAGGMGEVYQATDTQLHRDVAIKVLPDSFAGDPDRLARFTREAQTLASLNHQNIAHIHGLEGRALVMELVEGDDLSQRIARLRAPGASARQAGMPLDEVLPIAKQIADALEAAHEQGIVHRDLKPANIKVRADGTVKVLDFGLAKAMDVGAGRPGGPLRDSPSMSPTITSPALMTGLGTILGTAAYMAPEQARGKSVDKRSDIWAFGCVLFEMLAGRRLFEGQEMSDVLAAVLRQDIDWTALPAATPPRLRRLLARCLDRDPRTRLRDIGEARVELDRISAGSVDESIASPPAALPVRAPLAWMAALAVAAVAIIALAIPAMRYLRAAPAPAPPETRTDIVTPNTDDPELFALSPDGRQIVFVASGDGAPRLWLRSLAATTARPLAGTEGARFVFWSPDARAVGFFAGGSLKRLDLGAQGGAAPQTLAPAVNGAGATWNADGVIVFAPSQTSRLMRVSASGGEVTAVTTLGPQQIGHMFPWFLPDGRRFLFLSVGTPDDNGIHLGSLDGSASTRLTPSDAPGVYLQTAGAAGASSGPGYLLWVRTGTLVAQRLDLAAAAVSGEPVSLAAGLQNAVSVSATGLVAYRTGVANPRRLTWFDRSGTAKGTVGEPDATLLSPRVASDGRRVAVTRTAESNFDLWLLDGTRRTRVTFDAARDDFPIWSPDGTRIVFRSTRMGSGDLFMKITNGAGEERLVASDRTKVPSSWSPDGRFLLYINIDPQTSSDLWVMPMALREPQGHPEQGGGMDGDPTPSVFLKTPFRETFGVFSPDGRWVAYQSNESGQQEIYVRSFVPPSREASADKSASSRSASADQAGDQRQVSTAGGIHPTWRPDGKELYYLNPAGAMMAAPMAVSGSTLEPGTPAVLFPTRIFGGGVDAQQGRQYDIAPDGRFLINTLLNEAATPITLLQNWDPEGKR